MCDIYIFSTDIPALSRINWWHVPAEVVIAQTETAGVHFSCCELPSSQRRSVPVDALDSWAADAPCATVAITLPCRTLLIGVCWKDSLS